MGAQVRGTRNPPLIRRREAELHESVAVHGAHRGGGSCARDAAAGAQCGGDHCGFGTQGCAHAALVVCELHHGLLRQPHKLLGHQAYQCLDLASAGQCEGRRGCGCFHSALPESRLRRWHGGL